MNNKIHNENNGLKLRLFFGQHGETGQIQGKIHQPGLFLTELSTETGDSFTLAPDPASLQQQGESMTQAWGF